MRLTIENKSLKKIVLNSSLGWVDPVATRSLEVTIAQLEAVRSTLVSLQSSGLIVFSTEASGGPEDDAAEGATVSIASGGGGGGVPTTRQINTAAPLAGGGDLSANRTLSISAATTAAAGSMSASDKLKLDGIEAGAQVNVEHNDLANLQGGTVGEYVHLTAAQVSKLDGIEANADVTDATNVASAGAVMSPSGASDGDLLFYASGNWQRLPAGADGDVLQVSSGMPSYSAGSSGPSFRGIRISSPGSYLQRAANSNLIGSNGGFETVVIAVVDAVFETGLGQRLFINNGAAFSGAGYFAGVDDARPTYSISDGAGTRQSVFFGGWAAQGNSKLLVMLTVGYTGTQRFFTVNGRDFHRAAMGAFLPNTAQTWRIGAADDGSSAATNMTIMGVAHKQNGALTVEQRLEVLTTFLRTGSIPDSVFTSRFAFDSLPLGPLAAASSVEDVIGSEDLTVVGSNISVVNEMFTGPAILASPTPAQSLSTIGSTMTGRLILAATTGVSVTVSGEEYVLSSTATTAATVGLGAPSLGKRVVVKDNDGNASVNNITISGTGTIDGQPSFVINTNWGSATFLGNGTNWRVVSVV